MYLHIAKYVLLPIAASVFFTQNATAQFSEYQIKGAMLYNFGKYITWPDRVFGRENTILLGILGDDPFGEDIDNLLKNRRVHGRSWEIRRGNSLDDMRNCHIVFVTRSKAAEAPDLLKELNSGKYRYASVLTIGDNIEAFCENGGAINIREDYLFTINSAAFNKAELIIDARLFQMAKAIESYGNK